MIPLRQYFHFENRDEPYINFKMQRKWRSFIQHLVLKVITKSNRSSETICEIEQILLDTRRN